MRLNSQPNAQGLPTKGRLAPRPGGCLRAAAGAPGVRSALVVGGRALARGRARSRRRLWPERSALLRAPRRSVTMPPPSLSSRTSPSSSSSRRALTPQPTAKAPSNSALGRPPPHTRRRPCILFRGPHRPHVRVGARGKLPARIGPRSELARSRVERLVEDVAQQEGRVLEGAQPLEHVARCPAPPPWPGCSAG